MARRAWAFLRVLFDRYDVLFDRYDIKAKETHMLTASFWKQTVERAVKTAAQFGLVFLGADVFNVLETDLIAVGGYALAGALVSVLTSLASGPFSESGTPSMVHQ